MNKKQIQYDMDTKGGLNKKMQAEWKYLIAEELKSIKR